MPITNFPFLSLTKDNYNRPWLPVKIINPATGDFQETYALIDTGADDCCVPSFFAKGLGHVLSKGRKKRVDTAGGKITVYSHTTAIEVYGIPVSKLAYKIPKAQIDYAPGLKYMLLGVKNFLDQFILKVDYPEQVFSIKKK